MTTFANANCATVDTEAFFPNETDRRGVKEAREVCRGCPELGPCLEFVMDAEVGVQRHGIYAGMTPRMRADLARRRAKEAS